MALPPRTGLRRLSRAELDATLRDLLGDDTRPARRRLPEETIDKHYVFDNDAVANREPSANYVEAIEALVTESVEAALRDPARRAKILPCMPASADDAACMKAFVADFGRRALRRPLGPDEQALYEGFLKHGKEANDFLRGVAGVLRAMLTGPEFVYRIEVGQPVAGMPELIKLTPYELATRMSYTLLGTTPDRWLLDEAGKGGLSGPGVQAAAERLLADPRARDRMHHFHAYWLGWQGNLPPALAVAMQGETHALIDDVVFEKRRDYRDLFLSDRTFIGEALRKHYTDVGASAGGAAWVGYGKSGRKGILSHGSVLAGFKTGDDTSITKRGAFVLDRLLCSPVPEPPADVNVDVAALDTQCKTGPEGFYRKSHVAAGCNSCHQILDPIGFGLEGYDSTGRVRTHDEGKPNCPIDTRGSLRLTVDGSTRDVSFSGPGALAEALVSSGQLEGCIVKHVYRFATGIHEDDTDGPALAALERGFSENGRDLARVWLDLVTSAPFGYGRLSPK